MVKKNLKMVTAFIPKKTYEFLPEIWQRIKEYAVPQYVEPVKIGERFIHYETEIEEGIRHLRQVSLCERIEDKVYSLQHQKKYKSPITRTAEYIILQTLYPHRKNHSKFILSPMIKYGSEVHPFTLFWIRRDVVGIPTSQKYLRRNEPMYWDTDKPHKDEFHSLFPFRKTFDPELRCQFIKTNLKKLRRNMFAMTPTGFQLNL